MPYDLRRRLVAVTPEAEAMVYDPDHWGSMERWLREGGATYRLTLPFGWDVVVVPKLLTLDSVVVEPWSWVVRNPDGTYRAYTPEEFAARFEIVEE